MDRQTNGQTNMTDYPIDAEGAYNNACIRNLIKLKLDNLIKILTLIIPSTPGWCWQPFVLENLTVPNSHHKYGYKKLITLVNITCLTKRSVW